MEELLQQLLMPLWEDLLHVFAPGGYNVVTTNMNISYIATTNNNELIARGRFVHKGRQTFVMECDIEDETGRKLAIATGSFFVIQRRPS